MNDNCGTFARDGGLCLLARGGTSESTPSVDIRFPNNEVIVSRSTLVASLDILAGELEDGGVFIGDGDAEDGIRTLCISCRSCAMDIV